MFQTRGLRLSHAAASSAAVNVTNSSLQTHLLSPLTNTTLSSQVNNVVKSNLVRALSMTLNKSIFTPPIHKSHDVKASSISPLMRNQSITRAQQFFQTAYSLSPLSSPLISTSLKSSLFSSTPLQSISSASFSSFFNPSSSSSSSSMSATSSLPLAQARSDTSNQHSFDSEDFEFLFQSYQKAELNPADKYAQSAFIQHLMNHNCFNMVIARWEGAHPQDFPDVFAAEPTKRPLAALTNLPSTYRFRFFDRVFYRVASNLTEKMQTSDKTFEKQFSQYIANQLAANQLANGHAVSQTPSSVFTNLDRVTNNQSLFSDSSNANQGKVNRTGLFPSNVQNAYTPSSGSFIPVERRDLSYYAYNNPESHMNQSYANTANNQPNPNYNNLPRASVMDMNYSSPYNNPASLPPSSPPHNNSSVLFSSSQPTNPLNNSVFITSPPGGDPLVLEVQPTREEILANNRGWGHAITSGLQEALMRGLITGAFFVFAMWLFVKYQENESGAKSGKNEGPTNALSMLGITPKSFLAEKPNVSFNDIKGCDEAKSELQEIVEFLKYRERFERLGGKIPKGVLLTGDPGTGKTLLARAVAGEANVPFFACSGSEFEEKYIGLGAKRIRELFETAKRQSPCIIFIDEIDAVGGRRNEHAPSWARMTLNQLLTELDGFSDSSGVIVIGATNLSDTLDPALKRPGRFDKHVKVPLPDLKGRQEILDLYSKKFKLSPLVDLNVLARGTPGFSGADLFNLLNSAATRASAKGLDSVSLAEIEYAKDNIMMGHERLSSRLVGKDLKMTAYHECGHTLVGLLTPGSMDVHKVTVVPRGRALGVTHFLPEDDMKKQSKEQLLARMDTCMGGRVAEELIFGSPELTTGCSSDMQSASNLARFMVMKCGMGKRLGLLYFEDTKDLALAAPETQKACDDDVNDLLQASYNRAKNLLAANRKELDLLADALMKHEILDEEQIRQAIAGKPITFKDWTLVESNTKKDNDNSKSGKPDNTNIDAAKKKGVPVVVPIPSSSTSSPSPANRS